MNEKYELINEYLDWYENLLTQKQRDVMNLYYREDYSLQEIAENLNVSRSAVSDLIHRVITTLNKYEEKLNLVEKFHIRSNLYDNLNISKDKEIIEIVRKLIDSEQ